MARTVSSSVLPARTFGDTGSSGLRVSIITAQRRRDCQRVVASLGQVSEQDTHVGGRLEPVLRRDAPASGSDSIRPSAIASSASCASCMSGVAK